MLRGYSQFFNRRSTIILTVLFLFLLYFGSYLVKAKDSFILIHDNLDSLNDLGIFDGQFRGQFFLSPHIENFYFPGVEKIFFLNPISFDKFFFKIFGYFWGFIVNELVYRIIAFVGLYLLFKRIDRNNVLPKLFKCLLAFSFVSLPFYPPFNLSIAGLPLIILLFDNLLKRKYVSISYVALFLFTFYSGFIHFGIFVLFLLGLIGAFLFYRKILTKEYVIGIVILTTGWVISNYSLFMAIFFYDIPTTRMEMMRSAYTGYGLGGTLKTMADLFLDSQYHAHSLHKFVILPSSILIGIYLFTQKKLKEVQVILPLLIYIVAAAVIYGLYFYLPLMKFYERYHFGFNFSRFYYLSVAFWYILWFYFLLVFCKHYPRKNIAYGCVGLLLIVQLGVNFKAYTLNAWKKQPTFAEFVSEKQFQEIKDALKIGKERIGCIGFYPSVANYNGIYTVDAYKNIYPLAFKNQFYEVIKGELDRNEKLKNYFVFWGSRAYLYDDLIGHDLKNVQKIRSIKEISTDIDTKKLKAMGTEYIFSTARILNAGERNLVEVYHSQKPEYFYTLYVYKIV